MAETLYRHKKRGTVYRILYYSSFQSSDNLFMDNVDVVVYQDVNDEDKVWVREYQEFFDGRFEEVN